MPSNNRLPSALLPALMTVFNKNRHLTGQILSPRAQVLFRQASPALPIAIGMVLAQGAVIYFNGHWVSYLALMVAVLLLIIYRKWSLFSCGVVSGLLSVYLSLSFPAPAELTPVKRRNPLDLNLVDLTIRLTEAPRFRIPGTAELTGQVLASQQFAARELVQMQIIDLPWKNTNSQHLELNTGTIIKARAECRKLHNDGLFGYQSRMIRHGYVAHCKALWSVPIHAAPPGLIERLRSWSLEKINGDGSNPLGSALLASIALGIRDILPDSVINEFKSLGLAHLLVLSGYQVTLVYISLIYLVTAAMKALLVLRPSYPSFSIKPLLTALAVLITAVLVAIAGFDGASTRALLAAIFYVVFQWRESAPPPLHSLSLAMIGLNTIWPGSFLEPGTQLTFAALIGLSLAPSNGPSWWKMLLASTWATTLSSLVAAIWFGQLSLAGFILNPILAPSLSALACYGVALVLLVAPFSRTVSDWLVAALGTAIEAVTTILHPLSQQNWAKITLSPKMLLILLLFLSFIIIAILAVRLHRWLIINGIGIRRI